MATLLMRSQGPMQSWGTRSRFEERDTEREPSKSGIIGLICAALGRNREEKIDDLAALAMGVRADKEGTVRVDFHTALNVISADAKTHSTQLSRRAYLSDGAFLVGLESSNLELLNEIQEGLKNPTWTLFLGRKSFVPSPPVLLTDGLKENQTLLEALTSYPALIENKGEKSVRVLIEAEETNHSEIRWDQPVSFAFDKREFRKRFLKQLWINLSEEQVNG